jgi:RNA polymerase sigma factor (sigma-70 family)
LFPTTHGSLIRGAADMDAVTRLRAFEALVRVYWRPVYKYTRIRQRGMMPGKAEDLTQEFFTIAFEKRYFDTFDPKKGRFRTFLRVCLDRFLAKGFQASQRKKRGGGMLMLSVPFEEAERELQAMPVVEDVDAQFYADFVKGLIALSLETLREDAARQGKLTRFELFERVTMKAEAADAPSYAELAREYGLTVVDVTNYLARTRRAFRRIVLERLREVTANDDEFQAEARALFGVHVAAGGK